MDDPSKPPVIAIKCTACGAQSERHEPAMAPKKRQVRCQEETAQELKVLRIRLRDSFGYCHQARHIRLTHDRNLQSRQITLSPYLKSQSASFDQGEADNLKLLVKQNLCVPNKSSEQVGRDDRFCSRTAYEPASPNQSTQTSHSEA